MSRSSSKTRHYVRDNYQEQRKACSKSCEELPTFDEEELAELEEKPLPKKLANDLIPYTFRIPAPLSRKCSTQNAKSPPFYLQLDHTLAVIWCLFRNKKKATPWHKDLGVGQLQWALFFLKGIKSPNGGQRAADVNLAIETIENALLERYADLSNIVLRPPKEIYSYQITSRPCTECTKAELLKLSTVYPALTDWTKIPQPKSTCNVCTSSTLGLGKPRKSGDVKTSKSAFIQGGKILSSESQSKDKDRPSILTIKPGTFGDRWISKESTQNIQKEIMELRKAAEELNKRILQPDGMENKNPAQPASQDYYHTMLDNWKKEQVQRIETEIRRLFSIEQALGVQNDTVRVPYNKYKYTV